MGNFPCLPVFNLVAGGDMEYRGIDKLVMLMQHIL